MIQFHEAFTGDFDLLIRPVPDTDLLISPEPSGEARKIMFIANPVARKVLSVHMPLLTGRPWTDLKTRPTWQVMLLVPTEVPTDPHLHSVDFIAEEIAKHTSLRVGIVRKLGVKPEPVFAIEPIPGKAAREANGLVAPKAPPMNDRPPRARRHQ